MLRWFENLIDPFEGNALEQPPQSLWAFYVHYAMQVWPFFVATMVFGFLAAIVEVALFTYVGDIVDLVKDAQDPSTFFADNGSLLLWMGFIALIARPILFTLHEMLLSQAISPSFSNLVRWQNHRYVIRQSMAYFQNDFAGRIAQKVMQTGAALQQSLMQLTDALWFVAVYWVSAMALFASLDGWLAVPLIAWVAAYVVLIYVTVPRLRERAAEFSEARSQLTGRIVDSYTNMHTIKLFAGSNHEDEYARAGIKRLIEAHRAQNRIVTYMEAAVWSVNGLLIVATCGLALWLWSTSVISVGAIALTMGLVLRINNMSAWVMNLVSAIFEAIGTTQNGMETISVSQTVVDAPHAKPLVVSEGQITFDRIGFDYGKVVGDGARGDDVPSSSQVPAGPVIDDLSLMIRPGEKVGLVGRSGAGKSTLVNLLLRFYDLENGRIAIDGQDIATVTQDSLRRQIGMVTQDTSLLHRSVMDNIRYGRPEASDHEVIAAAKQAQAHDFILGLEDMKGRMGYQAQVGERGVKLSGGQRQRIAIARVLLKNAPILVLDEATSALDSEVEVAVQEQFDALMRDKTVIAIAHRLSTIAAMDRLVIMDAGRIVEVGTHEELVARGGIYAGLWAHQSGGFLSRQAAE